MLLSPCITMSANGVNPKPSFLTTRGGKKRTFQRLFPTAGYYDSWNHQTVDGQTAAIFPSKNRKVWLRGLWVSFGPLSYSKWKSRKASDEWEGAWHDIFNWIKKWAAPNRTLCARPLSSQLGQDGRWSGGVITSNESCQNLCMPPPLQLSHWAFELSCMTPAVKAKLHSNTNVQ